MADTVTQNFIDNLITIIRDAEDPESVTNDMVAQVFDFLNKGYKNLLTNNSAVATEKAERMAADQALQSTINAVQVALQSVTTLAHDAQSAAATNKSTIDLLLGRDASQAIENFNEILSFLHGMKDSDSLVNLLAEIRACLDDSDGKIEDLLERTAGLETRANSMEGALEFEQNRVSSLGQNLDELFGAVGDLSQRHDAEVAEIAEDAALAKEQNRAEHRKMQYDIRALGREDAAIRSDLRELGRGMSVCGEGVWNDFAVWRDEDEWRGVPLRDEVTELIDVTLPEMEQGVARWQDAMTTDYNLLKKGLRNAGSEDVAVSWSETADAEDADPEAPNVVSVSLSVTERAKRAVFIDQWRSEGSVCNRVHSSYAVSARYDPDNAPDIDHPFWCNGIWLTYDEALEAYGRRIARGKTTDRIASQSLARTVMCCVHSIYAETFSFNSAFLYDGKLEVVRLSTNDAQGIWVSDMSNAFNGCNALREITPSIEDHIISAAFGWNVTFNDCISLEKVFIKKLSHSLNFKHSPLLSYESLRYLVDNAANTGVITITVHKDVYAKLTGDMSNAAAQLTAAQNQEWQGVLTDALAKNISFATV